MQGPNNQLPNSFINVNKQLGGNSSEMSMPSEPRMQPSNIPFSYVPVGGLGFGGVGMYHTPIPESVYEAFPQRRSQVSVEQDLARLQQSYVQRLANEAALGKQSDSLSYNNTPNAHNMPPNPYPVPANISNINIPKSMLGHVPTPPSIPPPTPMQHPSHIPEESMHNNESKDAKWAEVRKYSEYIRGFAIEAPLLAEISKEKYYDLYNMAVCLLKCVDSLDPDKIGNPQRRVSTPVDMDFPPGVPKSYLMQQRHMSAGPALGLSGGYPISSLPSIPNQAPITKNSSANAPPAPPPENPSTSSNKRASNHNNQEEDPDDKKKRTRRRRNNYTNKKNLHCHMCGVTETPEWRRGPAGDHTLCNACGLHYAKSLKKQKKEREGRKHSIELLLNSNGSALTPNSSSVGATNPPANPSGPVTSIPSVVLNSISSKVVAANEISSSSSGEKSLNENLSTTLESDSEPDLANPSSDMKSISVDMTAPNPSETTSL